MSCLVIIASFIHSSLPPRIILIIIVVTIVTVVPGAVLAKAAPSIDSILRRLRQAQAEEMLLKTYYDYLIIVFM